MVKNALFARTSDRLCTIYCDEVQNFVAQENEIETVLSEARKTNTGFCAAHQFIDQLPPEMRAALLSVGTHAFFQLSSQDAVQVSQALGGGRSLTDRLKNLPQRSAIVKASGDEWTEVRVPTLEDPHVDYTDLLNRVRYTRGRVRAHVEREITERRKKLQHTREEDLE
jgi:hypothetical protein